eukprot:CAMPEP_0172698824 /NCGR_PEP_ID=MMETSP1074-20121228/29746_1 /TAXON_ID=2916 /ORGANISM="Ceratium fusus, Strain PA161109" /LENGTH=41 /DNA_ID= /DNA_START= /DNA_END= /DNA_ORIENTATION=
MHPSFAATQFRCSTLEGQAASLALQQQVLNSLRGPTRWAKP